MPNRRAICAAMGARLASGRRTACDDPTPGPGGRIRDFRHGHGAPAPGYPRRIPSRGTTMILRRSLLATALLAATGLASAAAPASDVAVPTGPLPRTVVPSEVGLHLSIDPTQERFSGRVEISVDVAQATDTIW